MFAGEDASGVFCLWVTNGTAAGTHELSGIGGADLSGVAFEAPPLDLSAVLVAAPPPDDFLASNTSDILFIDTSSGDTPFETISNGASGTPNPWQEIGGSDTDYAVAGVGDFYGTGSSYILFINASSGDPPCRWSPSRSATAALPAGARSAAPTPNIPLPAWAREHDGLQQRGTVRRRGQERQGWFVGDQRDGGRHDGGRRPR
jgi:hypothetical protein